MSGNNPKMIKAVSYLVPDLPVEIFQAFMEYLEETLRITSFLIYESRWRCPPKDRNLFSTGDADIGFMNSSGFLRLLEEENDCNLELCPVGVVHENPMVGNRAVYFSDVIMRSDNGHEYKEFHDLKGHKFAYSEPYSMSGAYIVLDELKNQKTNSSFFGDIFQSGSHLKSIQMVLKKQVDAAAIDSRVLKYFLEKNPHHERELTVLTSLGPMPTYPIVFRKNLPAAMKTSIVKALLAMPKNPKWASKLSELYISNLISIDMSLYNVEKEIHENIKGLTMNPAYY